MKVFEEISLPNFQFWSGAKQWANEFTYDELEQIESILEDAYPDGVDATTINDLFWFEVETLCDWLGYKWDDDKGIVRPGDEGFEEEEEE